jgi:hypothetical protein
MNKTIWQILAIGTVVIVIISLASMNMPQTEESKASQSCWANEDPLMATLPRYNDAYHGLTDENEKEDLARLYLLAISKNILVLPSKQDLETVRVVLPVTTNDDVVMVLREIQLGSNNGLHGAFQKRNYKRSRYEPPFYPAKIEKLINRIISGCGEA